MKRNPTSLARKKSSNKLQPQKLRTNVETWWLPKGFRFRIKNLWSAILTVMEIPPIRQANLPAKASIKSIMKRMLSSRRQTPTSVCNATCITLINWQKIIASLEKSFDPQWLQKHHVQTFMLSMPSYIRVFKCSRTNMQWKTKREPEWRQNRGNDFIKDSARLDHYRSKAFNFLPFRTSLQSRLMSRSFMIFYFLITRACLIVKLMPSSPRSSCFSRNPSFNLKSPLENLTLIIISTLRITFFELFIERKKPYNGRASVRLYEMPWIKAFSIQFPIQLFSPEDSVQTKASESWNVKV